MARAGNKETFQCKKKTLQSISSPPAVCKCLWKWKRHTLNLRFMIAEAFSIRHMDFWDHKIENTNVIAFCASTDNLNPMQAKRDFCGSMLFTLC
jgi:hypothetical protein